MNTQTRMFPQPCWICDDDLPSAQDNEVDVENPILHVASHGIEIWTVEEHDSLRKQVEQGNYYLLVTGGYSHPMRLQFISGGVTQSILSSSKMPVLVSH